MIRRPPAPLLYELVGVGMTAYARLVHRTVVLGVDRLRLEPGVVLVSTHLSDADVPVLGGALYGGARLWASCDGGVFLNRDPRGTVQSCAAAWQDGHIKLLLTALLLQPRSFSSSV